MWHPVSPVSPRMLMCGLGELAFFLFFICSLANPPPQSSLLPPRRRLPISPWRHPSSRPMPPPNPASPVTTTAAADAAMKQWKSLVGLHSSAPFPYPEAEEKQLQEAAAVRLVGSDGRVRTYRRTVTTRELMLQHPRHLVYRSDALLIGEKIPAVAPAEELQPGQAYFLLPAHLFHSVLSFVSLASSLLLLLSTSSAAAAGKKGGSHRPFELLRTASGTLQIKFSDDFLVDDNDAAKEGVDEEAKAAKKPAVLRGDERLEKEYEELVGYGKARRWAPKLETIEEVVVAGRERRKGRGGLPFLGRLGSRRRRDATTTTLVCGNGSAVACSG